MKKLTAANASNLIVTADHGFIYQHRAIEESDFSSAEVDGRHDSVPRSPLRPRAWPDDLILGSVASRRPRSGLTGINGNPDPEVDQQAAAKGSGSRSSMAERRFRKSLCRS